jgi:hypothetical protein
MLARFEGADNVVQTRQIGHFFNSPQNAAGILDDPPSVWKCCGVVLPANSGRAALGWV